MNEAARGRWRQWFEQIRTIEKDWLFYLIAFLPFFLIGFAVWICLDEAIFALRYNVIIHWSLLPNVIVSAPIWHLVGIILFLNGLFFMGFTLLLQRKPYESAPTAINYGDRFRFIGVFRRWVRESLALFTLGVFGLLFLCSGLGLMRIAFISQSVCSTSAIGIPCFTLLAGRIIETLYLHQVGNIFVATGLVLIFIVIIRERTED